MDSNIKTAVGAAVAGYCGYRLGFYVFERRKSKEAANKVIMLGKLYTEIAIWLDQEGRMMHPYELEQALKEKLRFVALASKASED